MANEADESKTVRHMVSLAGRLIEEQAAEAGTKTQKPVADAIVRIVDGPKLFIEKLVNRSRLVPDRDEQTRDLQILRDDPATKMNEKLQAAQMLLDYEWLTLRMGVQLQQTTIRILMDRVTNETDQRKKLRQVLDHILKKESRTTQQQQTACRETANDGSFYFLDLPDGSYKVDFTELPAGYQPVARKTYSIPLAKDKLFSEIVLQRVDPPQKA